MSTEGYKPKVTEAQFQEEVVRVARGLGWRVMHLPIITTPRKQLYDNLGFPDLVLARAVVVHIWELKIERGSPSTEQCNWLVATKGNIFRPSDWDEIAALLSTS